MTYRGLHLPTAALVFILVLAVGLIGRFVYDKTQVTGPLEAALQRIPGVDQVRLENRSRGQITAYLELDREAYLAPTLQAVWRTAGEHGVQLAVCVQDTASPELVYLFNRLRIAAEEAIMTGQFTVLEQRVGALAGGEGVAWDLSVDRDFVYVSLRTGDHVLRRVISRAPRSDAGELYVGGGVLGWANG